MKRLIPVILALFMILNACAAAPQTQTAPPSDLPEHLLRAASLTAYAMQRERLYENSGDFAPIADTKNLALSAAIPVYVQKDGALQPSEQTRWLMLADGGVIGEASWPSHSLVLARGTELANVVSGFSPYTPRSFDSQGGQAVALLNQCLTDSLPIAFVQAAREIWLLHGDEATLLTAADPEGGFPGAEEVLQAAKGLPLAALQAAYSFSMATWEQFYYEYEYDRWVYPYAHLSLQDQIRATLLDTLIYTLVPTQDLFLAEPVPVYVARDGEIKEEPVVLQPVFSGDTCIGWAKIYKDRLLQLRLYGPQENSALCELLTGACASGDKAAILAERETSYLLCGGSATSISTSRAQSNRDALGSRSNVETAAKRLRAAQITRAEEIRFDAPLPDREADPMGYAVTVHLLSRALKTGQPAELSQVSLAEAIPTHIYGADEQFTPSETQLVPIFRDQTLLGAMYWYASELGGGAGGVLWPEEYPEVIAALQRAYDTGEACCRIEDAQQVWLVCGDEARVLQDLTYFDQSKACFESPEIAAIAAQYLQRVVPAPVRPLVQ